MSRFTNAWRRTGRVRWALVGWVLAATAQAQPVQSPVQVRGQLNLGYRVDAAPFAFKNAAGEPDGYMVELCRRVAAGLTPPGARPLRINPVVVPPDQILRYLRGGTVDLFCAATTNTAERREIMSFSHPLFIAKIKLLVHAKEDFQSVADLKGQPVVVIGRSTADQLATDRAEQLQWRATRALDAVSAMGQLNMGWVKAYARDDALLMTQVAQSRDPSAYRLLPEGLTRENIAIAVRKDDPALLAAVNATIEAAIRDGSLAAIYRRWFLEPIEPLQQRAVNIPLSSDLLAEWSRLQ